MARYIDPFIDFGFKYLFGREESKPFLMDFLNQLLKDEPGFTEIVELEYMDKEKNRVREDLRGIIYDIHCRTSNGKQFTVEMQNRSQPYFFDRIIYYGSKAVVDQGVVGPDWKYEYLPVYCVSFMNFVMPDYPETFRVDVGLCDLKTKKLFSDKQRYIFIQLPLFKKEAGECENELDKWIYNIINMSKMETMAFTQNHKLFRKFEDYAEYAALSPEERLAYDTEVKAYRDMRGQFEFARMEGHAEGRAAGHAEGRAEGRAEVKAEFIREMAQQGIGVELISAISKMPIEEINRILGK